MDPAAFASRVLQALDALPLDALPLEALPLEALYGMPLECDGASQALSQVLQRRWRKQSLQGHAPALTPTFGFRGRVCAPLGALVRNASKIEMIASFGRVAVIGDRKSKKTFRFFVHSLVSA